MKRVLALACFCLVFAVPGWAQQSGSDAPATKEDVEAYLQAVHSHEMMLNMMDAMIKPMHQMSHQEYLKNQDKLPPDFEEHMNKIVDDMMKNMPLDEMMQAMVPSYQKHFTKGDIDAMLAFYSSPTGQKVLRELPAIMSESMQNIMPIMSKYMETVKERMQQEVARLLQQTPAQPAPSAPVRN
jgi:hypothetical protein